MGLTTSLCLHFTTSTMGIISLLRFGRIIMRFKWVHHVKHSAGGKQYLIHISSHRIQRFSILPSHRANNRLNFGFLYFHWSTPLYFLRRQRLFLEIRLCTAWVNIIQTTQMFNKLFRPKLNCTFLVMFHIDFITCSIHWNAPLDIAQGRPTILIRVYKRRVVGISISSSDGCIPLL